MPGAVHGSAGVNDHDISLSPTSGVPSMACASLATTWSAVFKRWRSNGLSKVTDYGSRVPTRGGRNVHRPTSGRSLRASMTLKCFEKDGSTDEPSADGHPSSIDNA